MEHVTDACLGLRWEPNGVVEPELLVTGGSAGLRLGPHPHDADRRSVIMTFRGMQHASIGYPNDEGRPQHRLWGRGLSNVYWVGTVECSELIKAVDPLSAGRSTLTHWVILLKEETAEVVAESLEITRE